MKNDLLNQSESPNYAHVQKRKKVLTFLYQDRYSFLILATYAALFFITCQSLRYQSIYILKPFERLKLADKIVGTLHVMPIILIAILHLSSQLKLPHFKKLLSISRGYLVYDIGVMLFFPMIHNSWIKVTTFIIHHLIFIWATYQVERSSRILAQGILAELSTLPLYMWWSLESLGILHGLTYHLVITITLITVFFCRILNFTLIAKQLLKTKEVTSQDLLMLTPLLCLNYFWFISLLDRAYCQW